MRELVAYKVAVVRFRRIIVVGSLVYAVRLIIGCGNNLFHALEIGISNRKIVYFELRGRVIFDTVFAYRLFAVSDYGNVPRFKRTHIERKIRLAPLFFALETVINFYKSVFHSEFNAYRSFRDKIFIPKAERCAVIAVVHRNFRLGRPAPPVKRFNVNDVSRAVVIGRVIDVHRNTLEIQPRSVFDNVIEIHVGGIESERYSKPAAYKPRKGFALVRRFRAEVGNIESQLEIAVFISRAEKRARGVVEPKLAVRHRKISRRKRRSVAVRIEHIRVITVIEGFDVIDGFGRFVTVAVNFRIA